MSKVIFTIEAASAREMFAMLETFNTDLLNTIEEHSVDSITPAPEPEPAPALVATSPPKAKKGATKTPPPAPPVAAAPEPEPEPVPTPAPEPTAAPVGETPSLETLKALVTQAVLAARKGNGAEHKITNLLPGFKTKTGLNFVMEAKEEHKAALHDLVIEAGLV